MNAFDGWLVGVPNPKCPTSGSIFVVVNQFSEDVAPFQVNRTLALRRSPRDSGVVRSSLWEAAFCVLVDHARRHPLS